MEWKVLRKLLYLGRPQDRTCLAIRGAITVSENSVVAIREAVNELLDELEANNQLDTSDIISATFSTTHDLDAFFPAAIARERPHWSNVPLLDVQQMHVKGSLEHCIRLLLHFNTPDPHIKIYHPYLRQAQSLRPDWGISRSTLALTQASYNSQLGLLRSR